EFWLDDGNIVLVAQDTAFRVYRRLLATQSKVFADMLVASSADTNDEMEGCPVVRLSDSPQDFTQLLRVMLPLERCILFRDTESLRLRFADVAAVVRLAHKYQIEDLQRQALSALKEDLTNFERCTSMPSRRLNMQYSIESAHSYEPILHKPPPAAIGIVNLARLTDSPPLLIIGLYICCCLGGRIVDGWKHDDGTVEYLSPSDLRLCVTAQMQLVQKNVHVIGSIFEDIASNDCESVEECEENLKNGFVYAANDVKNTITPNVLLLVRNRYMRYTESYCNHCESMCIERELEQRRETWWWLPELFGLQ
ncbi:hypothetical protein C8Q80DRAFT_1055549, partial [Daedaleopsis nitida]